MAIFNRKPKEKNKEVIERKPVVLKEDKIRTPKKEVKKEIKKESKSEKKEKKSISLEDKKGIAYKVLKQPHITEKASLLTESNKYVFEVFDNSNKVDIAKAIKNVYKVDVEKVRIINIPKKRKRVRRNISLTGGMKKAIVTIKKGQKIEVI